MGTKSNNLLITKRRKSPKRKSRSLSSAEKNASGAKWSPTQPAEVLPKHVADELRRKRMGG